MYKFDEGKNDVVCVSLISLTRHSLIFVFRTAYASFGGLLMALTGSYRHMQGIVLGENIYLLIRR